MVVDTQQNNPETAKLETDLDKLKSQNAEFEKELIRAREMRAERQKIEAENLLSGTAGAPIEVKPAPVETPKEYAARIAKGQLEVKK